MNRYRSWCSLLFGYDWVGIPLVYTQVSNTVHATAVGAGQENRNPRSILGVTPREPSMPRFEIRSLRPRTYQLSFKLAGQ
jgi:hypothetical protein